jgi:hypothetical protein
LLHVQETASENVERPEACIKGSACSEEARRWQVRMEMGRGQVQKLCRHGEENLVLQVIKSHWRILSRGVSWSESCFKKNTLFCSFCYFM